MKKIAIILGIIIGLALLVMFGFKITGTSVNININKVENIEQTNEPTIAEEKIERGMQTNASSQLFSANAEVTFSKPQSLKRDDFIGKYKNKITDNGQMEYQYELYNFYDIGEINNGKYSGQRLILLDLMCDGMCFSNDFYRFAYDKTSGQLVLLSNHSREYIPENMENIDFKTDKQTVLDGLSLPETISIPSGGELVISSRDAHSIDFKPSNNIAFKSPEVGNVYYLYNATDKAGEGCFVVEAPDGTFSIYELDYKFFDEKSPQIVKWNDGSSSINLAEYYKYLATGCGITGNCFHIEDVDANTLVKAGETQNGVEIFMPKNNQNQYILDSYELHKSRADVMGEKVYNFESFLAQKPVIYFKDAFGRFSQLRNMIGAPIAECGKPVIYLYPEKTMDVNVKVGIDKFTATIPNYTRNGWTVNASPNGTLYNYNDKKTYPYLFWEGTSEKGINPTQGFLINRNNIETFLNSSLTKMGLSTKEKADFMDFWLSRMLDNKEQNFFISFLGKKDFGKIAPLNITPNPDTLIRVFMYYHPTNETYNVQPQRLVKIPRNGFTVIEWGGTSSVAWIK